MATVQVHSPGDAEATARLVWDRRWKRRIVWGGGALVLLLLLWLLLTAPLSRSLEPQSAASVTFLSTDGEPIARRGAVVDDPVRLDDLPDHVWQAFVAIEDRRFDRHLGVDPRGIGRAFWRNLRSGSMREGGSTITQQLAKQSFLTSDRNIARKLQEMILAVWLEARLSKDEILERYLSTAYFGDNVYGLRAAGRHYFDSEPENLTTAQAAMLAGLVKAPTSLAPTSNLSGARDRAELVIDSMVDAGFLERGAAERIRPASLRTGDIKDVPRSSYFADWIASAAGESSEPDQGRRIVQTTLDSELQKLAERTIGRASLGKAQVALVAMRPDGRVVAMVGGKDYSKSPFNRATQAKRQPGSTFKLFVYLAAAKDGLGPASTILDAPVTVDGWSPSNSDSRYRGLISLREAFTISSNVAAVRLAEQVGRQDVIRTAQELGIDSELSPEPSLALGTNATTLVEMTAAYAAVAGGAYPVTPHGVASETEKHGSAATGRLDEKSRAMMLDLLWSAANVGTGRAAALKVATFGKTGTTQDNRDAIFIGFAHGLVTGVWIGNDDNSPLGDVAGGGLPARLWSDFMAAALGTAPAYWAQPRTYDRSPSARRPLRSSVDWGGSRGRSGGKGKGKGRGKKKGKKGR